MICQFASWSKKKVIPKTSWLGGRYTNSSNHSMNSLRSNSISYFVAQIADAIRDSISIQRICIPLKTSSCGMFGGLLSFSLVTTLLVSMFPTSLHVFYVARLLENILASLRQQALCDYRTSYFHVSANKFSKTFRTKRYLQDVLLSESSSILVSRKRDKQIDMRCCLSGASSSNDYDNITSGL